MTERKGVEMATLHVRGVPDELYEQVRLLAQISKRSLSAEIIQLLEQALADETFRQQQTALLNAIWLDRYTPPAGMDSVAMLREDRER